MKLESIGQELDRLKHSSHFIAGDPGSFKVKFSADYELPGKDDPAAYLDRLGLKVGPNSVFVLFPGNGGLCVELLKRGSNNVVAMEPRGGYLNALVEVSAYSSIILQKSFSSLGGTSGLQGWRESFDTVVWSEGLDSLKDPMMSIANVYALLKHGGKLLIEVTHGQQEMVVPPVNSWRPKEEVFEKALAAACPDAVVRKLKGRLDRRVIYELTRPVPAPVVEAPKVVESAPVENVTETPTETSTETHTAPALPAETPEPANEQAGSKPKRVSMKKRKS